MTRGRKKSTFITQESVPDDHFIDTFGAGVNRKIPKPKLFKQIRDEAQTFIYPTVEKLQQANLEADPDNPIYVRVAENGFLLYQITSLEAGPNDIELDNGATATFQQESIPDADEIPADGDDGNVQIGLNRRVISLPDITALSSLNTATLVVGQRFTTSGYYSPGDGGHNEYIIEERDGSADDGGSIIYLNDEALQARGLFLSGVYVNQFGADPTGSSESASAIQAAVDYLGSKGGGVVRFLPGTYLNDGVEVLYHGIVIDGTGRSSTEIVYTNSEGTAAAFSFGQSKTGSGTLTPVSGCAIKNMSIDGNRDGGARGSALRTTVFDGIVIENVHVRDCAGGYGFGIVGTGLSPRNDIIVKNCSAIRCGADGMDIKAGLHRVLIDGFYTAGHLNETDGDALGLDVRGQYVSVNNVWATDCLEAGVRIRINSGIQQDSDWGVTQDAQVAINNVFSWENRDGVILNSAKDSAITASNIHTWKNTRFGVTTGGPGSVTVNGGSSIEDLVGLRTASDESITHVDSFNGFHISRATQDGISFTGAFANALSFNGGSISGTARYALAIDSSSEDTSIAFVGTVLKDNFRNVVVTSGDAKGYAGFVNCKMTGATDRGLEVASGAEITLVFNGGTFKDNATQVHSSNENTKFINVNGINSRQAFSEDFPVDATGGRGFSFAHNLWREPREEEISYSIRRVTDVNDYALGFVRTNGISSSLISSEVLRTGASGTAGAEARLICVANLE